MYKDHATLRGYEKCGLGSGDWAAIWSAGRFSITQHTQAVRIAKEPEVGVARETRPSNLRRISKTKSGRVRRTRIPTTSLVTVRLRQSDLSQNRCVWLKSKIVLL